MIIRIAWLLFKGIFLSILLLLSFCTIQMYLHVARQIPDDSLFIEIGFPFHFFYFSIDGNGLHGSKIFGLFYDIAIFLPPSIAFNYGIQLLNNKLRKKNTFNSEILSEEKQPIDR